MTSMRKQMCCCCQQFRLHLSKAKNMFMCPSGKTRENLYIIYNNKERHTNEKISIYHSIAFRAAS